MSDADRLRFIHDLHEFNDQKPTQNALYHFKKAPYMEVGLPIKGKVKKILVEILAFCLMPNHFHIMVKQITDNGITIFMRKLGTGYTNYFNEKYKRSGALFQGIYKSALVNRENHFIHLPYYIHLNPLDLIPEGKGWRDNTLKNRTQVLQFLKSYRWSSHLDYAGQKNFPSVIQHEFLTHYFATSARYKKDITQWLKEVNLESIHNILLE